MNLDSSTALPALVTLLLLVQYLAFTMMVGAARVKGGVDAPACSGNPEFERAFRVQQNTMEQLMLVLPALWICAYYFRADVAAICGSLFFIGRIIYRIAYMNDPSKRGVGMIIGFAATIVMLGCALWGVISRFV